MLTPATDQNGSQVNFYYGAPTPYAESIAPSHHSTYAHYYDDEEDGWEMPNFYNETYMKGKSWKQDKLEKGVRIRFHAVFSLLSESLHNGKMNSLARSNASIYGTKDDLYDRLKRHAYPGKKGWCKMNFPCLSFLDRKKYIYICNSKKKEKFSSSSFFFYNLFKL